METLSQVNDRTTRKEVVMMASQLPIERPTIEPSKCVCGEEEGLEVQHEAGQMRMTCPCGLCSPWETCFDNAYIEWNELQGKLMMFELLDQLITK
jgi:hypothetical protein